MKGLDKVWMAISLISIIIISVITDSSFIQIIAAVCGVIYVFSTVLENKYGQIFGIINTTIYGYLMYKSAVYGTAIYDILYCVPMQIYTFFTWGKDKKGKNRTEISKLTTLQRVVVSILVVLIIAIYTIVAPKLNVQFALIDGISIILGVVGMYLVSKKKIEQWVAFIISNVAMIVLWSVKCTENIANIPMLVMWMVYFVNNTYGLCTWSKKIKSI